MVSAETSTQPSTDFVLWLLVVSRAIYNEREKQSKEKYKLYSLRRTGAPESVA